MRRIMIVFLMVLVIYGGRLTAAELRLRQQCVPHGSVIRLCDVAEIHAADQTQEQKLSSIELFPAPTTAQPRLLRVRELQDLLILRGVNLTEHQFSGSSHVVVTSATEPVHSDRDQSISVAASKRSQRRLQEALLQYLRSKVEEGDVPVLQFELSPALARAASISTQGISINGGAAPWTGTQRFEVVVETTEGASRFTLEVQITEPSSVVALVRALPRGTMVREGDVTLVKDSTNSNDAGVFHSLEEVVGRQTTRALVEGKILIADDVQRPLMVHKGDVTTVYACSSGIKVRTVAKALDDGGVGDLITLETMHDKQTYQARVCGVREAEVLAQAVTATEGLRR